MVYESGTRYYTTELTQAKHTVECSAVGGVERGGSASDLQTHTQRESCIREMYKKVP